LIFNGKRTNLITQDREKVKMPTIADAVQENWKFFAKVDIKDAYHHFKLKPEMREYFSFCWGEKFY